MLRTIATISALAFLLAACGHSTTDRAISGAGIGAGLGAAGSLATGGRGVTGGLVGGGRRWGGGGGGLGHRRRRGPGGLAGGGRGGGGGCLDQPRYHRPRQADLEVNP